MQTTCIYLESIFGASAEDVRQRLPTDSALFDAVHAAFKKAIASMFASRTSAVQVQSLHMHEAPLAYEHFLMRLSSLAGLHPGWAAGFPCSHDGRPRVRPRRA